MYKTHRSSAIRLSEQTEPFSMPTLFPAASTLAVRLQEIVAVFSKPRWLPRRLQRGSARLELPGDWCSTE